jgi:Cu(I)/Ag(I) efflux system membrane fusion protein
MDRRIVAVIGGSTIVLAALLLSVFMGLGTTMAQGDSMAASGIPEEYYTCPMHPSVRSDRPGSCPVCGMALVKKSVLAETATLDLKSLGEVSLSPAQRVLANVSTTGATRTDLRREIVAVGNIVPAEPRKATVSARFNGRIEKLFVDAAGARVRAGDTLFTLYSPDLISAEQEFLLSLETANGGDRLPAFDIQEASRRRLIERFGLTEEQVRELAVGRKVSSTVTFRAPLGGTVLEKNIQEGQYVSEGAPLYGVADLSIVWALLDVYEDDLRFVHVGQTAALSSAAYPGIAFSGKVMFVEPEVNPETRTVRVRVELPNGRLSLRPNMYVSASIGVAIRNALAVPTSALLRTGRRNIVWQEVRSNVFQPREVAIGATSGGLTEIFSGLEEGSIVASSGGYLIDSESQLQQPSRQDESQGNRERTTGLRPASPPDLGAPEVVKIRVKGGYTPDEIRVKAGRPLILQFYRDETSMCSREVVFPSLNIKRELPAWRTTEVRFTPPKAGEIPFECGMGMLHGRIIVER